MITCALTLQVFRGQENGAQMVVLYQLAYLWCDGCAIEAHHEQLAHGPFN